MNYHSNAKLTENARKLLVERARQGMRVADAASMAGVSRTTAYKWIKRFARGDSLKDMSSRPHRMPRKTSVKTEEAVVSIRNEKLLSPLNLELKTGVPARTCARIIKRYGCVRLSDIDRVTGEIRQRGPVTSIRYEKDTPGELVHMDVKKVTGIPDGGGWRATHKRNREKGRPRTSCLHVAIDDHSRVVYVELLPDEKKETVTAFTLRAIAYFESLGVKVQGFLTDNGPAYHSIMLREALEEHGIKHKFTKPYHPWTNGKAERFNRIIAQEWQYAQSWISEIERKSALAGYVEYYNNRRPHSALAGKAPMSRIESVNNVLAHNT